LNVLLEHIGGLLDMKWVFAPEPALVSAMESSEAAVSLGAALDPVGLQNLRHLTNIGHRKGILEMLYRMRDEHPHLGETWQQMIHLADTLQLQALSDLLHEENHEAR